MRKSTRSGTQSCTATESPIPSITNGNDSISTLIERVMKSCKASPSAISPRCNHSDHEQEGDNKQGSERSAHIENRSGPRLRSVRSRLRVDQTLRHEWQPKAPPQLGEPISGLAARCPAIPAAVGSQTLRPAVNSDRFEDCSS